MKDGAANEVNNKWNMTPLGQEQEKNEAIKYLNQLIVVLRTKATFQIWAKSKEHYANMRIVWVV